MIVPQANPHRKQKPITALSTVAALSLGGGGWSVIARADDAATSVRTMLRPEHYELSANGVVIFSLEDGRNLSLTPEQYLILDDGLLMIIDELAQSTLDTLPVQGAVRMQMLTELVADASSEDISAILDGTALRLTSQVELETYELAQATTDTLVTDTNASAASGASAMLPTGGLVMLSMLMTADQPVAAATNSAPVFTSGAAANFLENDTATVYTATATDADGDALNFAILAGKDAASFSINAGTGALTFVNPPDFENPTDLVAGGVAGDNVYVVDLEVTDGNGGVANQTVSVTVTDVVAVNLTGAAGADVLNGTSEDDFIDGNQGDDYIDAGAGADTVDGGPGVDDIVLGQNDGAADTVRMVGRYGVDRASIWDFETGIDTIAIDNTAGVLNGTSPSALVSVAGLPGLAIDNIIADNSANLGLNAVNVGDVSGTFTSGGYAFVTDTGQLLYDADGDFSAGVEDGGFVFSSTFGTLTPASVVASDFDFGF